MSTMLSTVTNPLCDSTLDGNDRHARKVLSYVSIYCINNKSSNILLHNVLLIILTMQLNVPSNLLYKSHFIKNNY